MFSLDGEHVMKHRIWYLLLIPALATLIALFLFVSQRGFGGGHGDFDMAIGVLGLPSILLIEQLPVHDPDIVIVVLLPAVLNFIAWSLIILALRALLRGKQPI